jgi:hypothetical protein
MNSAAGLPIGRSAWTSGHAAIRAHWSLGTRADQQEAPRRSRTGDRFRLIAAGQGDRLDRFVSSSGESKSKRVSLDHDGLVVGTLGDEWALSDGSAPASLARGWTVETCVRDSVR